MEVAERGNADKIEYMKRYVRILKLISMWPRENINFIRYWTVFVVAVTTSGMILLGMYVKMYTADIDGAAEVVDFATVFTSGMFRYFYVHFRGNKYTELIHILYGNFVHTSFAGEPLTLDRFVKLSKYVCNGFIILTQMWLIQMCFSPFVYYFIYKNIRYENGTSMYPDIDIQLPLNIPLLTDNIHIGLSFIVHILGYHFMTYIYITIDCFWITVMILTTGQFQLIAHSLRSCLKPNSVMEEPNPETDENDYDQVEGVIVRCVKQHIIAREVVQRTEDLIHMMILVDFLHAVTSISFILLDTTIAINTWDWVKLYNLLQYFLVSVYHMFILDYFSNELTLKEQEIAHAIYDVPWYKYPKKLKTHLLLLIILARNPRRITGGKLYIVSLEFFAATMRNVFSYFMVLLQLRETAT